TPARPVTPPVPVNGKKNPVPKGAGFFAVWGISHPVALRLPGLRILGHLLAEGTSMPQSYRRQS
ncbi:hypothetical protein N0S74_23110, partial [Klebsiella pneumoniae]|uniref:hypothetical protein n=1 Tax=Klebsiella pneumoniae TaxID=573 RepID=UPI002180897F